VVYATLSEAWEAANVGLEMGKGGKAGKAGMAASKRSGLSGAFGALKAGLEKESGEGGGLEVALPARLAVVEQFQLPSVEKEELDGMAPLQLEKTLPYPIEEVLHAYRVIKTAGATDAVPPAPAMAAEAPEGQNAATALPEALPGAMSTLSVVAVHRPAIEALLAPLLTQGMVPTTVSLWGDLLAAGGTDGAGAGPACAIWGEGGEALFAVFEGGAIILIEAFDSVEALFEALPRLRIGAELAGIHAPLAACRVDPAVVDLSAHRPLLSRALSIPGDAIAGFSFATFPQRPPLDFTPPAWRQQLAQRARKKRFIRRAILGGAVYLGLLLLAFGGIALRKQQSRRLDAQLAAIRPQLDSLLAQQSRWKALGPAVDTRQFTLELLREVVESLPSPEVRVTLLEQGLGQFKVEVEAPTAAAAIDFGERLKAREALRDYQFEAGQPTLSGSDKAQYRLFGKL